MRLFRLNGWTPVLAVAMLFAATFAAPPALADNVTDAIKDGKVTFDLRYRYEFVDQADFDRNANASTIRLRLGYETGDWHGFFVYSDLEANEAIGSEGYNSTANGNTQYPVVADPQDAELNQFFVGFRGWEGTKIQLGRQRLTLDNHRFVGNVGWRQLEQTFDALSISSKLGGKVTAFYSHVGAVNRVFGAHNPDPVKAQLDTSTDLVNVGWDTKIGKMVGYLYMLELHDAPDASHRDYGIRFTGKAPTSDKLKILYGLEYAKQTDYQGSPSTVDAEYIFGELGVGMKSFTAKVGYELLSGDGTYAFQTPLATLHKFNGFADKFLTTPADGLADTYLHLSGTVGGIKLFGVYHDFKADSGGDDYGTEFDVGISKNFNKTYTVGLKYADYSADAFGTDTDKFWFWLQAKIRYPRTVETTTLVGAPSSRLSRLVP